MRLQRDIDNIISESKTSEETTFDRFYSEIKAFLTRLMNKPLDAEPSKYLQDRGFTKKRLIKLFMDEHMLSRTEKILIPNKDNVDKVKYNVKYKLNVAINDSNTETFENKLEKIHKKYFGGIDKQINEALNNIKPFFKDEDKMKKQIMDSKDGVVYKQRGGIKECDCGGCCDGGGDIAGATNTESSGQFTQPMCGVQRREPMLATKQKKDKGYVDPTKILGKTINECPKGRRVIFTEEQMNEILKANGINDLDEATTTCTTGDYSYATPGFDTKHNPGFWKDSLNHKKRK